MKKKPALTPDERAALDALVLADVKKPRERQRITFSPETVKAAKLSLRADIAQPGSSRPITDSLGRLKRKGLITFCGGGGGAGWKPTTSAPARTARRSRA